MTDKSDLRARMRVLRRNLAERSPDAALRLASHAEGLLGAISGWAGRGRLSVALYRAKGAEIDPTLLAHALTALSCDLCLPVAIQRDAPLMFRAWAPGDPLAPDVTGSAAPLAKQPAVDPDLILCPLLAFDRRGGRLGQGGGYYDRTIEERRTAAFVGLAYAGQELDDVPMEPHDARLHGVLSEAGYAPSGISH